jgi:hypothetical protein
MAVGRHSYTGISMGMIVGERMWIVHASAPSEQARRFAALARCHGIEPEWLLVASEGHLIDALGSPPLRHECIVVDLVGLAKAFPAAATRLRKELRAGQRHILLLITDAGDATSSFLSEVTDDAVAGIRSLEVAPTEPATFTGPLASQLDGQTYVRSSRQALCLSARPDRFDIALSVNGEPSFGRLSRLDECAIFVWSAIRVFDVLRPLSTELEFEVAIDEFVPAIIFLRSAFGDRCWHSPTAAAGLIIDDPLLRGRYGCIDFKKLLASARINRYHVTLAFIPWNYWRTSRKDVDLFREHPDVFSVCVHGNDHTEGEFMSEDRSDLTSRAFEASLRMEMLRSRTGLPFESLMVFPQERYSVQALQALADSGRYSAIASTRRIPRDPAARDLLCGADLLLPAEDSWSGVPILKRHSPAEGTAKFALAAFLGRPIVVETHHRDFAGGTGRIESLVEELRRISPDMRWGSLTQGLRSLSWRRRLSESRWAVRFFSDQFDLSSGVGEGVAHYELSRRIPTDAEVDSVTVGGGPATFDVQEGMLRFEIVADTPRPKAIVVRYRNRPLPKARNSSPRYHAAVAARRVLSELRDAGVSWLSREPTG